MPRFHGDAPEDFEFHALPFEQAVKFFRAKGLKAGFDYRDVWQQEHQRSFTVAKAMTVDLLQDIRGAVDQAIADGIDFEDFRNNLEPILKAKGWWGQRLMRDPLTGEKRQVELGSSRRLGIIYDTNLRTSYSEGRYQQAQAVKKYRPYVEYIDPSANPRPHHLAWSGTVVPLDSEWAQAHWPPLAYKCACEMNTLSESDVARENLEVTMPATVYENYVNPRSGKSYRVPVGVHPSFAYPPGRANEAVEGALREKLAGTTPEIARAVRAMTSPSGMLAPALLASDREVAHILWRRPAARAVMEKASPLQWRAAWDYGADSDVINAPLRRGKATPEALALASLLEQLPRVAGASWRGIELRLDRATVAKFRAGKSLELYGFASASRSRYKALRFAGKEGVLIELRGKSGRNLSMLSPYPRQREVLFAPWVKFRIKSVRREGAILHVTAEEVD